jgi:hypothetical protein
VREKARERVKKAKKGEKVKMKSGKGKVERKKTIKKAMPRGRR